MGTVVDVGMRSGVQGRAIGAGGRQVRATSRLVALCTSRGGGEQVKVERASKRNGYGWEGGKKGGERKIQKSGD